MNWVEWAIWMDVTGSLSNPMKLLKDCFAHGSHVQGGSHYTNIELDGLF